MAKSGINQKKAAKEFAEKWCGRGDEKQDTQTFWLSLLRDVFGVANPEDSIQFEKRIKLGHTSFIDAYIPSTKVLIEQKSIDVDLLKPAKQSDGTLLTPYQQADRYRKEQNYSEAARWIVTCNFKEFFIYDMDHREAEPEHIFLKDLDKDFARMQFLINQGNADISREEKISLKAGELVGKLYDALFKEYIEPDENSLRSLNILCVRIVFCLYAEDAGLFETRTAFEDYIKSFSTENLRDGIIKLFKILNTKPENRDKYDTKINSFPYTNGGLFADDTIEIPNFTKEIVDVIVNHCAPFDWSEISPTIFGAVFESTLNPETRRKGGMHYTSIENIHKVIDPLFLDGLRKEFYEICGASTTLSNRRLRSLSKVEVSGISAKQRSRLEQLRDKIASLTFLDPACGSGNFLTETYISLRRLENECLKVIHGSQMLLSSKDFSPIKVKISQFYGIEINDFAVTVAKTALWIAESQMMKETEEIVEQNLDFLPLSTNATIVEGNALRMDWRYLHEEAEIPTITAKRTNLIYPFEAHEPEVKYEAINLITDEINVGKPQQKKTENHYDYIMGNPPFVGSKKRSEAQREDVKNIFKGWNNAGNLDYVACWYKKASDLIKDSKTTRCAFVSTNSITQGEEVATLWKPLFDEGIRIDFAWKTFKWTSESEHQAAVHCVIVGFSCHTDSILLTQNQDKNHCDNKKIFNADGTVTAAKNINGYLADADNVFLERRQKPLCNVPEIIMGPMSISGNNLILTEEERENILRKEPESEKWIKRFSMGREFIDGTKRYCLWLKDISPAQLRNLPMILNRVKACKEWRESQPKTGDAYKLKDMPHLFRPAAKFDETRPYFAMPQTSSENRKYIPMAFVENDMIPGQKLYIISDADLYLFGVMTSNVHNAWTRTVCGRLEMRYSYSIFIVYNNFPWCNPTDSQKAKIEQTAQAILDARAKYPDSSLADLYDETTMPPDLRKAHKENDKAVMAAYGFDPKMSETEIVAELFKMYEKLAKKKQVRQR
jgi:hypothetical protein